MKFTHPLQKQNGSIAFLVLFILALGGVGMLMQSLHPTSSSVRAGNTTTQLAIAKSALIGNSVANDTRPGKFVCPDTNDDGISDSCSAYIGRLPWKTLGLGDLRDAYGERLWYALSPALKNTANTPANLTTTLEISMDGQPNIAAVIFSPGPPLQFQTGRPSNNVIDYLEESNADGDSSFVSHQAVQLFNDQTIFITREELFIPITKRVFAEIRGRDSNPPPTPPTFGLWSQTTFPWADINGDGIADPSNAAGGVPYGAVPLSLTVKSWISSNQWFTLITYERLTATTARLKLGTIEMSVSTCLTSPCT
jgi:hypothetical protein